MVVRPAFGGSVTEGQLHIPFLEFFDHPPGLVMCIASGSLSANDAVRYESSEPTTSKTARGVVVKPTCESPGLFWRHPELHVQLNIDQLTTAEKRQVFCHGLHSM
jgi:hypothetical protein